MKSMNKTIATQVYGDQSLDKTPRACYREVAQVKGRSILIRVIVDSRPRVGYACLSVWSKGKWRPVYDVEGGALLTPHTLATRKRKAGVASFKRDRDLLVRVARAVLS